MISVCPGTAHRGTTPLAAGLDTVGSLIAGARHQGDRTVVVVLTDGRATSGGSDPLSAATAAAQRLAAAVDEMVIVDTEVGYPAWVWPENWPGPRVPTTWCWRQ